MVTLGGDEARAHLLTFSWSLKTNKQRISLQSSQQPFAEMRSLLECHAAGVAFSTAVHSIDAEEFDCKMNRFFNLSLSRPSYSVSTFSDHLKVLVTYLQYVVY